MNAFIRVLTYLQRDLAMGEKQARAALACAYLLQLISSPHGIFQSILQLRITALDVIMN